MAFVCLYKRKCMCNSIIDVCLYVHAYADQFPDMLCIEGFYSVIGSHLVASEGGRVVIQTAAGRGPDVGQTWARRGPGVGQAWARCASKASRAIVAPFSPILDKLAQARSAFTRKRRLCRREAFPQVG